jgi:hypothetical protein
MNLATSFSRVNDLQPVNALAEIWFPFPSWTNSWLLAVNGADPAPSDSSMTHGMVTAVHFSQGKTMTDSLEKKPFYAGKLYRLIAGAFGALLVGVGCYGLFFSGMFTILRLVVGFVFVLFGCNMIASAYQAKESWLSKIGPLP